MGVHGLQSWVRSQSSLATTVTLPSSTPPDSPIPLVLDGLAFLYQTAMDDTLRGGNYHKFRQTMTRYIEYWRAVGLEPIFVWDGPFGAAKVSTVLSRSAQNVEKSIKYFRSNDHQRAIPATQRLARRLPPLTMACCLDALRAMGVEFYVAEEEADSPTAELAQKRYGFMASNDSDYFIFNSACRGYIPLQTMEYGDRSSQSLGFNDWPSASPTLRFQVFHHQSIAKLLSIPENFLPIFASLVGNDVVDYAKEFALAGTAGPSFPGQMDAATINRIGRALASLKHMPAEILPQIQDIVFEVLPLLTPTPSTDLNIITNISLAALTYSLQSLDEPLPTFPLHPSPLDSPLQAKNRATYLSMYKTAQLGSAPLIVLQHGIWSNAGSVDNPDFTAPAVTFGKPIRKWIYAVLDAALGFRRERDLVVEYDRRGNGIRPDSIVIDPLSALVLLPSSSSLLASILDSPPLDRLYLYACSISWPSTLPLPTTFSFFPLVAALRHIQNLTKRPWDPNSLTAALLTAVLVSPSAPIDNPTLFRLCKAVPAIPRKEFIQASAELIQTLAHLQILAELLLLTEVLPPVHTLFEGTLFHAFLEVDAGSVVKGLPEGQKRTVETLLQLVLNV